MRKADVKGDVAPARKRGGNRSEAMRRAWRTRRANATNNSIHLSDDSVGLTDTPSQEWARTLEDCVTESFIEYVETLGDRKEVTVNANALRVIVRRLKSSTRPT
jgi:ribosomal protein L28